MAKDKKNPIPESDKQVKRVEPELESDSFGTDEQKVIVKMIIDDAEADKQVLADWKTQKELDLKHYAGEKPSILENLTKRGWQSDRNLGLCAATCDIYQATLLVTCWNPDTIHFKATEENDIDNKDNLERFAKWVVLPQEANVQPEVDDFIHNRVTMGFSAFKIFWRVWYEWVDKRIWSEKAQKYNIKTEEMRFEKGVMENIDDVDDLLLPRYGKRFQALPHMIHVIHLYADEILEMGERKRFKHVTEEKIDKLKQRVLDQRKSTLEKEKAEQLGLKDVTDDELRALPIDLYEWYGMYVKTYKSGKKRRERYRFIVEPTTETLYSGKPLRKINRTGKYPFTGGSLIRRPGFIKGFSLIRLITPVINAINNVFDQMSDFQYVTNCPFGFHKTSEGYTKGEYPLEPMVSYPTAGNPSEDIWFPNLSRSMAWAHNTIQLLFEILEKLTGAASYFLTSESKQATLGRDKLVAERGEVKFSLWVSRIQLDISEGITMLINLYQDWAPPKLGTRVLGKDGKKLIKNLSINSLRGNYDASMSPDITAGSKALERQMIGWGFANLNQTIWLDPRINPKGSWNLAADTSKKIMGTQDPERYLGPEPKPERGTSREIEDEWAMFVQGDEVPLQPGENPLEHLVGHEKQKDEKYYELDEEYRPNFDKHLFATRMQFQKFIRTVQQERMADRLATSMIMNKEAGIGPEEIQRSE